MAPVKKHSTGLFYIFEETLETLEASKSFTEDYIFDNVSVKLSECRGMNWVAHLLCRTSNFVDKFGLYGIWKHSQGHIKTKDKDTLEGK